MSGVVVVVVVVAERAGRAGRAGRCGRARGVTRSKSANYLARRVTVSQPIKTG